MEQYQNPVIIEQPEKKKPHTGLQIAALILGVVGFALAFVLYFSSIFRTVFGAVAYESGNTALLQGSGIAVVVLGVIVCIICLIGFILGVVGLVKSIRRATRTVKGIVLSAIGLQFAAAGFVLVIVSGVVSSVLGAVIPQIMQNF